ncbi:MAG: sigma-54-dependent Fis family transcriptional regulator [Myxococcales bacterium]|nr:sigma-54-dependent Fis family transcriptional regulator [Myxococcales bacterium]
MRIALATRDQDLIEQISAMAQRCGAEVDGSVGPLRLLSSRDYDARLIECRLLDARQEPSLGGVELGPDDWLLLLRESLPDGGVGMRLYVVPTHRRGELLDRIEEVLPRRAWIRDAAEQILGDTPAIRRVEEQIRRVARFRDISVLVLGETGTGKELVAEAVHQLASGDRDPFVAINCAAIPAELFESELFGHEAGAYTGARGARVGLLEAAGSGTVFLDEVGEMPMQLQPKLLRALETREFRRIGANTSVPLKARVISATNRGFGDDDSSLRLDLQFRLAGFTIVLPPLRERLEDIEVLARHFVESFAERQGIHGCGINSEALAALRDHSWPGNVRELRSTLDHAAILCGGTLIDASTVRSAMNQLQRYAPGQQQPSEERPSRRSSVAPPNLLSGERVRGLLSENSGLRDIERDLILSAFEESGRNLSKTSRLLGLPRTTLRAKLRRYGAL